MRNHTRPPPFGLRAVSPRTVVVIAVATAVLVLWSFLAIRLADERQQAHAAAVFETGAMARVIEEQTAATLRVIDTVLIGLQHELTVTEMTAERLSLLDRLTRGVDGLSVAVVGPDGGIKASTVPFHANLFAHPSFQIHLDPPSDLHVGRPQRGALLDRMVIPLSRRLEDHFGRFSGIILAEYDLERLAALYDSLPLRPASAVTLTHQDGTLAVRSTRAAGPAASPVADLPAWRLAESAVGTLEAASEADGVRRIHGYRSLQGLPYVIMVGMATGEVYGGWTKRAVVYGGAALTATLLAAGLAVVALRADRHREDREASLRIAKRALQSSTNGIVIADARVTGSPVVFCNSAYLRLSGRREDAVIDRSAAHILGEADERAVRVLREALWESRDTAVEACFEREDGGTAWCDLTLSVLRDASGAPTHFVGVFTDVTARREAGVALRGAVERAEAANAAKSLFLATMSHELRTPLNAIIGFSDVLLDDDAMGREESRECAASIHEAGHRLLALVNDLLDVAHLEIDKLPLALGPVSATDVLADCLHTMTPHARAAGLELALDLPADLPPAHADRTRVKQAMLHLLSNAVKFTPTGGCITVAAALGSADETGEGTVCVTVRDTGVGMRPDDIARVLQPFERGDTSLARRHDGAGLGLFIVQRLALQMGGSLAIDSAPGAGTAVTLRLPVARPGQHQPPEGEASGRVLTLARARGASRTREASSSEVA